MTTSSEEKQTQEWYIEYYSKKGIDRNDILSNSGVLFQALAVRKSVVEALRNLDIKRDGARILDVGCGGGGAYHNSWILDLNRARYMALTLFKKECSKGNEDFQQSILPMVMPLKWNITLIILTLFWNRLCLFN